MIDETDLQQENKWFYEARAKKAVESLKRNRFDAEYVPDRREAFSKVLSLIPERASIGIGDSITLHQIGILEHLEGSGQHEMFNQFRRQPSGESIYTWEERFELARKSLTADVFLMGVNAVTLDGKLVNTDGYGNRVAAMVFGPRRVIVVAGANKITRDVEEAQRRVKEWCAPVNARRHATKHHRNKMSRLPCVLTGTCADCRLPERICCATVIMEAPGISRSRGYVDPDAPALTQMNILLVGESLGI